MAARSVRLLLAQPTVDALLNGWPIRVSEITWRRQWGLNASTSKTTTPTHQDVWYWANESVGALGHPNLPSLWRHKVMQWRKTYRRAPHGRRPQHLTSTRCPATVGLLNMSKRKSPISHISRHPSVSSRSAHHSQLCKKWEIHGVGTSCWPKNISLVISDE